MDRQLQIETKPTDPWLAFRNNVITTENPNKFEDNFNAQFFAKLPDSEEYLAILERKLKKIKNNSDILAQLAEKREACMQELLSNNIYLEVEEEHIDFDISPASLILKTIVPQKQALNQGELLQLVKNDHLETEITQDTDSLQDTSGVNKNSTL